MIFVTVGTQLPFDRMLAVVDQWAFENGENVFCQTGPTKLDYKGCSHKERLSPAEFADCMSRTSVLVSHAGIGSILSAMQYHKPVIIFPRKASLGEHRNEHQLATAQKFEGKSGIHVAYTDEELIDFLNKHHDLEHGADFLPYADEQLINALREFINS